MDRNIKWRIFFFIPGKKRFLKWMSLGVSLSCGSRIGQLLQVRVWVLNNTFISLTPIVLPVHAPHFICVKQLIKRCIWVQSVGADHHYHSYMWTARTVLQLSGNIGNLWGKLTPTLNYRLALTASLTAHQPAKPPSQQPSLTLPPPLKTPPTCSAGPSLAPHPSFQLTFAILRLMLSMCMCPLQL